MGRRKTGREIDGWLVVDKPAGVTSTQVVSRARWAFDARKAGHAGTLDPLADGLLAIAFGEATKTVPFAQDGLKTYRFTARWGEATATDDREGEVTARSDVRPSAAEIEAVLPRFRGVIMQAPPAYSAIKVEGERAYDLARRGEAPALAERPIRIEGLTLLSCDDDDHATFEMICGKGGYVRSMARDLGLALGTVAHVTALRRVASGAFTVDGATSHEALEALKTDPARDERLLPVAAGLAGLPVVDVGAEAAARLRHGDASAAPHAPADAPGSVYWARCGGAPVAVLETAAGDASTEMSRDGGGGARKIRRVFSAPA